MNDSWLAKYPKAAAMLQGNDDVLEYAADGQIPLPAFRENGSLGMPMMSAMDREDYAVIPMWHNDGCEPAPVDHH